MGTILVQGRGDGKHVALDAGGSSLRVLHINNLPSGNCFYVVMQAEESGVLGGVSISKGESLAFEFDGDLSSYSGYYRLLEGRERDQVLGNAPKPQPKPVENDGDPFQNNGPRLNQNNPQPRPQQPQNPTPRPAPVHPTASVSENPGGKALGGFRDFFYVLGIIWGIAVAIGMAISLFLWITRGLPLFGIIPSPFGSAAGSSGDISSIGLGMIISLPLSVFFILSAVNCIICMKHRKDIRDTRHNAVMIIGLLNFNPFAILGGYLNYRLAVHKYKIMPAKAE